MATIYINGKFTAQPTTGVQRVAAQLVLALDRLPGGLPGGVVLMPPGGTPLPLRNIEQRVVGPRSAPLHLWEQACLPWAARDGLLVSLAGSAPWFGRRQAAMLHDAAVFDCPQAYRAAFVAWYRRLFGRHARRASRLFTVSAFSQQRLAHWLGTPATRLQVLPNGVDHMDAIVPDERVLDAHGLRDVRFVLAVGSDNPTKNLPALEQAFARLPPEPSLRLVIAGGRNPRVFAGPPGGRLTGVVRTGALSDAALKALYLHAAVLVFPSTYEGFGLPPLEAMACGCPVACARAASMPEVCGDAALYFDPVSVDAIAAAMARLLADEALCARLRAAGRQRAAAFRWRRPAALLRDALRAEARA